MSSEEEDTNPKYKETKVAPGKNPVALEENMDLEKEEAYDDEEDTNLQENDSAIKKTVTGIDVSVSNPQMKDAGTFSKNYTVYEVSGSDKNGNFSVKRRYNEFNELRKKLVENWPGYFIPPIPEKKTTGNTNPEFVKQRQHMLNHFMVRCGRMQHIFYSEEMQMFLRSTSNDLGKALAAIKALTPTQMYERNKALFPEYDKEITDKVERSVKKYFSTLESTIKFFNRFRAIAKNIYSYRSKFKTLKTQFVKYAINDYKNKLKGDDYKKNVDEQFKDYQRTERDDDLINFLRSLKDLELDLNSFFNIKEDLKKIRSTIEKIKKKQEEANKNLARVRSQESAEIKDGLFKKVSKNDMIRKLETEIADVIFKLLVPKRHRISGEEQVFHFPSAQQPRVSDIGQ
jgi:PX domain